MLEELLSEDAPDDDLLVEELFEEAEALADDALEDAAEVDEPCGPDVVQAHPNTSTHANAKTARQSASGRFVSFFGTMSCSFQCDYSLLTKRSRGAN